MLSGHSGAALSSPGTWIRTAGAALQKWGFSHVRQAERLEFHVFSQAGTQQVSISPWTIAARTVCAFQELQHLLEALNAGLGSLGLKSPLGVQSVLTVTGKPLPAGSDDQVGSGTQI